MVVMTDKQISDAIHNIESRLIDLEIKSRGHHNTPKPYELIYFRDNRERYLRREILDKFASGEEVDMRELRSAVAAMVNRYCELGDALERYAKLEREKVRPPVRREWFGR